MTVLMQEPAYAKHTVSVHCHCQWWQTIEVSLNYTELATLQTKTDTGKSNCRDDQDVLGLIPIGVNFG